MYHPRTVVFAPDNEVYTLQNAMYRRPADSAPATPHSPSAHNPYGHHHQSYDDSLADADSLVATPRKTREELILLHTTKFLQNFHVADSSEPFDVLSKILLRNIMQSIVLHIMDLNPATAPPATSSRFNLSNLYDLLEHAMQEKLWAESVDVVANITRALFPKNRNLFEFFPDTTFTLHARKQLMSSTVLQQFNNAFKKTDVGLYKISLLALMHTFTEVHYACTYKDAQEQTAVAKELGMALEELIHNPPDFSVTVMAKKTFKTLIYDRTVYWIKIINNCIANLPCAPSCMKKQKINKAANYNRTLDLLTNAGNQMTNLLCAPSAMKTQLMIQNIRNAWRIAHANRFEIPKDAAPVTANLIKCLSKMIPNNFADDITAGLITLTMGMQCRYRLLHREKEIAFRKLGLQFTATSSGTLAVSLIIGSALTADVSKIYILYIALVLTAQVLNWYLFIKYLAV